MKTIAFAIALAAAVTATVQQPARAHQTSLPEVPLEIQVPDGNKAFLIAHAVGTQNYMCLPAGSSAAWTPIGPQATLFNETLRQVTTHFLSPNPVEGGIARATWQHSRDTSSVWAVPIASSTDPAFVAPDAIPWLLLEKVGTQDGAAGGHKLTATTFIHRLNTVGGRAPAIGCAAQADVGKRVFVPYEAIYVFYRGSRG